MVYLRLRVLSSYKQINSYISPLAFISYLVKFSSYRVVCFFFSFHALFIWRLKASLPTRMWIKYIPHRRKKLLPGLLILDPHHEPERMIWSFTMLGRKKGSFPVFFFFSFSNVHFPYQLLCIDAASQSRSPSGNEP